MHTKKKKKMVYKMNLSLSVLSHLFKKIDLSNRRFSWKENRKQKLKDEWVSHTYII